MIRRSKRSHWSRCPQHPRRAWCIRARRSTWPRRPCSASAWRSASRRKSFAYNSTPSRISSRPIRIYWRSSTHCRPRFTCLAITISRDTFASIIARNSTIYFSFDTWKVIVWSLKLSWIYEMKSILKWFKKKNSSFLKTYSGVILFVTLPAIRDNCRQFTAIHDNCRKLFWYKN